MLNEKIQKEMNDQVQRELESAYIYLSMAAYFDSVTLPGLAQWMKVQFQEEQAHALKFYDFIGDRGGRVMLQPIGQPRRDPFSDGQGFRFRVGKSFNDWRRAIED